MENYEYHGYICESGSVVCRGGNPDTKDSNKINWTILPSEACTSINERIPGAIEVPKNCGNASRDIQTPGINIGMTKAQKTTLMIGGSVVGICLIVGGIYFYKKSKSKK